MPSSVLSPGHGLNYARALSGSWKKTLEAEKEDGVVLSYKILSGVPTSREDFDTILLIEYPNFAALDQQEEFDAVRRKTVGTLEQFHEMLRGREEIREAIGGELMWEIDLK